MRRAVEFLVDMLPLDTAGRRAVDETMADWKHEACEVRGVVQETPVAVRGLTAAAETLVRVTARDVSVLRTWAIFGVTIVATLALSLVSVAYAVLWQDTPFDASTTAASMATLLPATMAAALPLVLLMPPFDTRRGVPVLGLSLMLLLTASVNTGWIVPASTAAFRHDMVRSVPNRIEPAALIGRSLASSRANYEEQTIPQLFGTARSRGFEGLRAAQAMSDRLAYVTLAPAALLLGVQSRRFVHHRGWRAGAGAIAVVIAAFATFPAVLVVDSVREFLRSQFYPAEELRFLRYWVSPLVVLGACAVLSKLTDSVPRLKARP